MSLLDRYVLRNFLEPFLMCFTGFVAIWLIIDLADNFNDFIEAHASFRTIFEYYVTQVPQTVIMAMPVALMLGLLFALSRMSRRNELIAQLTAGRSVMRVLVPVIAVGIGMTAFCFWLNWDRAPHAELIKKTGMQKIKRGKRADEVEPVLGHLFRDRLHGRTWFVKKMRPKTDSPFEGVHVTQQDPDGRIVKKWYGNAQYNPTTKKWRLEKGMIIDFTPDGDVEKADRFPHTFRIISDWEETPLRVASAELDPAFLGVGELEEYLTSNSDFTKVQLAPYRANLADRYALPLQCLLAVFIGAPLGIFYNRSGVIGGVTAAVILLAVMILAHFFFLVMGKGLRLDPNFSPWIPNIVLGLIGVELLWFRAANRDFPRWWFWAISASVAMAAVLGCNFYLYRYLHA
jgi:lipopolysaccharide export LptBFGC system permease protein LptF